MRPARRERPTERPRLQPSSLLAPSFSQLTEAGAARDRAPGAAMEGRRSAVRPGQVRVAAVWAYLASDTLTIRWVTGPGPGAGAAGSGERVVIWPVQGMGGWP